VLYAPPGLTLDVVFALVEETALAGVAFREGKLRPAVKGRVEPELGAGIRNDLVWENVRNNFGIGTRRQFRGSRIRLACIFLWSRHPAATTGSQQRCHN